MPAYVAEVAPRYADLDPMEHVNHAVYATYLEVARHRYYADVIGEAMDAVDVVVAHLEIDYDRPIGAHQTVEVRLDVPSIGESSITMAYELYADGEQAATARTVQVIVDPATGEGQPVPEAIAEPIVAYHGIDR